MNPSELQTIEELTGVTPEHITLANDGFWSRGYIIDGGRIVFKFKKAPEVSYKTEIKALEFISSLHPDINIQRVGWISPDDSYLGVYGVIGEPLDTLKTPNYANIGKQLADFLRKLHQSQPENAETMTVADEIAAWQERYRKSQNELKQFFSEDEIVHLDHFIFEAVPTKLQQLGEKLVFSHGDLGGGNILVDDNGKVGIIDFSEMLYLDEAADFMDVGSNELREQMLKSYGADDNLREKVHIRVLVRPLFVFGDYARRGDTVYVNELVVKIKELLNYDTN